MSKYDFYMKVMYAIYTVAFLVSGLFAEEKLLFLIAGLCAWNIALQHDTREQYKKCKTGERGYMLW